MFPSSSAWSDPTDGCSTESEDHLARLADALRVIDFQHWGLAPVSFELLYFILHCLSMWGIERDHIPWLVQTYVDALKSSGSVLACTRNDLAGSLVSVEALMEEMLAIVVEYYASFLTDDGFNCQRSFELLSGNRPGLQTLTVRAASTAADAVADITHATDRRCATKATASVGVVHAKWSFSTDASARICSEALTRAAHLDALLDLGELMRVNCTAFVMLMSRVDCRACAQEQICCSHPGVREALNWVCLWQRQRPGKFDLYAKCSRIAFEFEQRWTPNYTNRHLNRRQSLTAPRRHLNSASRGNSLLHSYMELSMRGQVPRRICSRR